MSTLKFLQLFLLLNGTLNTLRVNIFNRINKDFLAMPFLLLKTNCKSPSANLSSEIIELGGEILSEELNKSLNYVMVLVENECNLNYSGDGETPCAYLKVKNVGYLSNVVTKSISARLTALCQEKLNIKPNRVYIDFQQYERHMWGWNGTTFA